MGKFNFILASTLLMSSACLADDPHDTVRFATFNVAMGLNQENALAERLSKGGDKNLAQVAEILQRVRPDVLLLNEFDYSAGIDTARLLHENYLSVSWDGQQALDYPFAYAGPVNTGIDSGLDLDNNGRSGDPGDAWGFGRFPGQYGMLVLSRFPIDVAAVRTFREYRWQDMPGALKPVNGDGSGWYAETTWAQLKLSSKSHWDLPLDIRGTTVHFLVSHPTPSVFDGPEDRNGRRNHDEIRLWADYVAPQRAGYLVDDAGTADGLPQGDHFVIAGDLNSDPYDGDSTERAIWQLLEHPRIDPSCLPRSTGAAEAARQQGGRNAMHEGDPAADTSDFNDERVGNLRIDYVLPSTGLQTTDCGVFWPASGEPGHALVDASDHRLVWIDLRVP